jgi:hypothetical protein
MGWQHREGQATRTTEITLDPLLERLFRLGITPVASMEVDYPRTTARTLRPQSFDLVFSKLNRGAFPKSSRSIKSLYFGLHDASIPLLFTNVPDPRSRRNLQRYSISSDRTRFHYAAFEQEGRTFQIKPPGNLRKETVSVMQKRILRRERLPQVPALFGWNDQRLVRENLLRHSEPTAWVIWL